MATYRGIPLSKISPAFLHANSTSHTWAFSAFAELIDNAYDPDVSASELLIDKIDISGIPCLIFLDNGAGMDSDHLLKMLSFGFCEKQAYERTSSHMPIGHYGNGFKSGSMRLAQDALVFTRCHTSASIGFLSQTYLKAINADSVFVPILTYRLPKLERIKSQESRNNLDAILKYSVFHSEQDLKEELLTLEGSVTGTKIILSNLKRLQDGRLELDFSSDETDIRCPEAHEVDLTSVYHRPIQQFSSEYKHSLKEYCSILFLRPRMKITIRGQRVRSKLISKSLYQTEHDSYKPTWLNRPLKITFGFTCEKKKNEDYGMMLYHRNRLIKAFDKVGYQKQPNDLGVGVVGVAQVDFLQPTHNKQDFNKDEKYNSVMAAFSTKLNDYWNEKKHSGPGPAPLVTRTSPDWLWAQCEQCLKWRRLPDGVRKDDLPEQWFCRLNPDPTHNRCEIPEEPEDEDLAIKPTYEKTFKRKQEERKRQQHFERQREEEFKRQRIMAREKELKQKEAELMAFRRARTMNHPPQPPPPQAGPNQGGSSSLTSLQRALAESQKREEHQKRMLQQIQEERRIMDERKKSILQLAESLKTGKVENGEDVIKKMSSLLGVQRNEQSPQKRKPEDNTNSPRSKRPFIKEEIPDSTPGNNTPQATNNHMKKPTALNSTPNRSSNTGSTDVIPGAFKPEKGIAGKKKTQSISGQPEVIDLTLEADQDVKPNVEELKAKKRLSEKSQGNRGDEDDDVKPDKDELDAALQDKDLGKENEEKVPDNSNQESKEQEPGVPKKEGVPSPGAKDNGHGDSPRFGPSEDDPEFKMGPTDAFHSNLEAAMAVIMEKMNEEKEMETSSSGQKKSEDEDSGHSEDEEDNCSEEVGQGRKQTNAKIFKQREDVSEQEKEQDSLHSLAVSNNSIKNIEDDTAHNSDCDVEDNKHLNDSKEAKNREDSFQESPSGCLQEKEKKDANTIEKEVAQIVEDLVTSATLRARRNSDASSSIDGYHDNFDDESEYERSNHSREGSEEKYEINSNENIESWSALRLDTDAEGHKMDDSRPLSEDSCSEAEVNEDSTDIQTKTSKDAAVPSSTLTNNSPPPTEAVVTTISSASKHSQCVTVNICHQHTQTSSSQIPKESVAETCPPKCISHKDTQTEAAPSGTRHDGEIKAMRETIDNLRIKQEVKTQLLEQAEERVKSLCHDVHRLLSFILPEMNLSSVTDTEQMIKNMIKSHEESSMNTEEGEDEQLSESLEM